LIDVFAQGDEDVDVRFGLVEPVQHVAMTRLLDVLAVLPALRTVAGGGAANAAKIAALLGLDTAFVGAVGRDRFGRRFAEEFSKAGARLGLVETASPTGICLTLRMPDGTARIAASPGAALSLSPGDLDEDAVAQAKVLLIDGYLLDRGDLVNRAVDLADAHGTVVAVDVSSVGMARARARDLAAIARRCPLILFMNEAESRAFTETLGPPEAEPGEFLTTFTAGELFPIAAVKLGSRGAVVYAGGAVYRAETIPVIPVEATGAGDAFCAAFLAAWIRDRSLAECAALGNLAAREVLNVDGTAVDGRAFKALRRRLEPKSVRGGR